MKLRISYSDLANLEVAASSINRAKAGLEEVIAALDRAVSILEGNWIGPDYEAFVKTWDESKPAVCKLIDATGNFTPVLDRTIKTITNIDLEEIFF